MNEPSAEQQPDLGQQSPAVPNVSPPIVSARQPDGPPALADTTSLLIEQAAAPTVPAGVNVNVNVTQHAPQIIVVHKSSGPSMLVRVLWFLCIGWWVGQLALLLGWVLILTVIGLPVGIMILNRLPQVFTLRPYTEQISVTHADGAIVVQSTGHVQHPWWIRAIYFVIVGWWLSLVWMEVAWVCGLTLVLLPVSFVMFSKVAAVTTLRRI